MKHAKYIFLIITLATVVSCASEKSKSGANAPEVVPPGSPYVPPGVGPGYDPGSANQYGGSAAISIIGGTPQAQMTLFTEYTCPPMGLLHDPYGQKGWCYLPNSPQALKLNLNMVKVGTGWGGTATISYTDNGKFRPSYFTASHAAQATKYNQGYRVNGQPVWHGVFEDFYLGALVVVIDGITDLGDGAGAQDTVSGSVWMKNFAATYAPHAPTYCWFIAAGPFDCRPWPSGDGMSASPSLEPQGGYIKLATFSGLSLKAAFNNQTVFPAN